MLELGKDLENRDFIDSNRAFAPLSAASDAIVLDTSDISEIKENECIQHNKVEWYFL